MNTYTKETQEVIVNLDYCGLESKDVSKLVISKYLNDLIKASKREIKIDNVELLIKQTSIKY